MAYDCDGVRYTSVPEFESRFCVAKPIFETVPGWKCDITKVRTFEDLPQEAKDYIHLLEDLAGVRVSIVTVGPDREQTINRFWN